MNLNVSSPPLHPSVSDIIKKKKTHIHPTLDRAVPVDDAFSVGVAGVGEAVPTGPLRLTAPPLIPNIAALTGSTPERALGAQEHTRFRERTPVMLLHTPRAAHSRGCSCRQSSPRIRRRRFYTRQRLGTPWDTEREARRCAARPVFCFFFFFSLLLACGLLGGINDLFVGSSVSQAHALDLRPAVARGTGTAAETRGRVDAAHAHVTGLHRALIHVGAVCPVALRPLGTGTALHTLRGDGALHPRVAGVRHAGGQRLHAPHP